MSRSVVLLVAALAGCSAAAGDIGSSAAHDAVVDRYDKEVQFADPRACDIFLEQRATDENARTVEYDARVGTRPLAIVYSIVATDPLPLQLSLFGAGGTSLLSVRAGDHALEVFDGDGQLVRSVDQYDGPQTQTMVDGAARIADGDALTLLGCAVAGRAALGSVPAFLRNLASGGSVPGQTDVGQTSSNAPPILADWKGNVSLLGAFWLVSACLDADGWHCGCAQPSDPSIGSIGGLSCP